ncbi:MAG: aminoacyl-tRNA hydrolase [Defluviitaleaceae bacterium]|nr:aminoacyl-tRNA hydrolase [Defluviitaleaceae bacterium]
MKLFVGLGNPGKKYAETRHNVGFRVIDELAKKWHVSMCEEKKFQGEMGSVHLNGEKVMLLKPMTYMNLSGESVQKVMDFYDLYNEDVIVIYDDLDMETGKVRGREKGSAGGHNGIKSMILHLAGEDFKRFKIGIGKPAHGKITDHVLGGFTTEEGIDISLAIEKVVSACEEMLQTDFLKAVSGLNQSCKHLGSRDG